MPNTPQTIVETQRPESQRALDAPGRVGLRFPKPSLAKQSFRDECNINLIMRKYEKDGLIKHLNNHEGRYEDYIPHDGYHNALNQILEAETMFNKIPSKIRAVFQNDAEKFLEFVQNPENTDEMVEMGLARRPYKEDAGGVNVDKGASAPKNPGEPSSTSTEPTTGSSIKEGG